MHSSALEMQTFASQIVYSYLNAILILHPRGCFNFCICFWITMTVFQKEASGLLIQIHGLSPFLFLEFFVLLDTLNKTNTLFAHLAPIHAFNNQFYCLCYSNSSRIIQCYKSEGKSWWSARNLNFDFHRGGEVQLSGWKWLIQIRTQWQVED